MIKNICNEDLLDPNKYQDTYKISPFSKGVAHKLYFANEPNNSF